MLHLEAGVLQLGPMLVEMGHVGGRNGEDDEIGTTRRGEKQS